MKLIVLASILVAGCAATRDYSQTSSMKLCIDYMSVPSYNIWQSAREQELNRRGENCTAYTQAASIRQQQTLQEQEMALRLMQPPPRPAPPQNCQWQTNTNGTGSMICR